MNLDITYNQQYDYIHVVTTGTIDDFAVSKVAHAIAKAIDENHCKRILNDMRDTKINLETVSIYNTPKIIQEVGYTTARRALVYSGDSNDFNFFETVSKNQGQNVRVFTDVKEARQWLLA